MNVENILKAMFTIIAVILIVVVLYMYIIL